MNDRLAELLAGERIIEPELDRAAGDPDGARGGLNPRALEGAHQLLEPLSLGAAEQRVGGRPHRIELERILANPGIAEHSREELRAGKGGLGRVVFGGRLVISKNRPTKN